MSDEASPGEDQHIPKIGDAIKTDDIQMILDAVGKRKKNFPDEPAAISFMVVMFNIGDRFSPVECIEGEWKDIKFNARKNHNDLPVCPNGHPLTQGLGLRLGWVEEK